MNTTAAAVRVAVVGASGYTGAQLVALLAQHPQAEIVGFYGHSAVGQPVDKHLPVWRGRPPMVFEHTDTLAAQQCDVVFFATPHTVAMSLAPACTDSGKVVIDLGADFRLKNTDTFKQWYGTEHSCPQHLATAVYGLSEIAMEELKTASVIACPGCYATAVSLALIPFAAGSHLNDEIIVDAKSGVSGAGRRNDRADLLLAEMANNFKAYAVDGHRHTPEILQTLNAFTTMPPLTFVPHLLPTVSGIHINAYIRLSGTAKPTDAGNILRNYWHDADFVEVLPDGAVAELTQVIGGNRAILSAHPLNDNLVLISAVLDNLIKGAAGQAVQNMNIRFGLPPGAGLPGAIPRR